MFGGKITTFRKLAEHALDKLAPFFPSSGRAWTARAPLPGGDMPDADFERWLAGFPASAILAAGAAGAALWPPLRHADRRRAWHGAAAWPISAGISAALLYEREARYLIASEWAQTAEDILERRTKHGLHLDRAARDDFANWLQAA